MKLKYLPIYLLTFILSTFLLSQPIQGDTLSKLKAKYENEGKNPETGIQDQFNSMHTSSCSNYKSTGKEIKKKFEIYSDLKSNVGSFARGQNMTFKNWTGKITMISKDKGSKNLKVHIGFGSGISFFEEGITHNNPIYDLLSKMRVGDTVYYSGRFSDLLSGSIAVFTTASPISSAICSPYYNVSIDKISKEPPLSPIKNVPVIGENELL